MGRYRSQVLKALTRALDAPLSISSPLQTADAIVVLGAPARDGAVGPVLEERLRAAAALWKRGAAPLVCLTGGGDGDVPEADVMAARAEELGIPASALLVERRARTTVENAQYCAPLLRARQVRRVWLVSQPFHLRRARYLFARLGFEPLTWRIADSIQYQQPARGLRWVTREYGAWAKTLALAARERYTRR